MQISLLKLNLFDKAVIVSLESSIVTKLLIPFHLVSQLFKQCQTNQNKKMDNVSEQCFISHLKV